MARFGRLVDVMPFKQYGMAYDRLVNTVRAEVPPDIRRCCSWADGITPGPDRQEIRLSDGCRVDVRLAVLASGGDWSLRESLGVKRGLSSPCHSITVGFDLRRADGGDFAVQGPVKVRPTDLHVTRGYAMPGVVMIGDAFATPCPATGTGSLKLFTDVERLCNAPIPVWMASPGMGVDETRSFYEDPAKTRCDGLSVAKAHALRAISTDASLHGQARRWLRFCARLAR